MIEYLNIGQIINTHGLQGEVKVNPLTDDLSRFKELDYVLIDEQQKKITSVKFYKDKVILKLEGIDSIDDAMKYRNKYLKVHRKDAVSLEENTYFIADLINCEVYDTEDKKIGKIFDVVKTGSNDVYWVKGDQEVLIPALKEIVVSVDVNHSKVVIKPIKEWWE